MLMKSKLAFALVVLLALPAGISAQNNDSRLEKFFQEYLDARFRLQPLSATQLGDHRFDNKLEDLSKSSRERWILLDQTTLADLPRRVEYASLSRASQVDYEILKTELERSIWTAENLHPFEQDPRSYTGYIGDSIYYLLAQSTLPHETNIANCLARIELIPGVIAAAKANLQNPPRALLETAINQNRGSLAFYETALFQFAGKTRQMSALKAAAARAHSALLEYQGWLEKDLLPRANGEWRLGKDKFYRKLALDLDAGVDATQALADARSEFDRVQNEMYVIARQLWSRYFPKRALPADDAAGRRATTQLVLGEIAKDHCTPAQLVDEVRDTVKHIRKFITMADILRLPQPDSCNIVEMPEFQRGNSTAYMNSPPALDPKAKGYYAVSPPPRDWDAARVRSYLEEYNRQMIQILTIHEAYPGHYVQFEYANRHASLLRRVISSGVYVEGWAVYTEQMMLDQGYGKGDLALRLTQLKFYLRAVANAILDHQMHCTDYTDDEALRFLTDEAYQSEGEARLKIIRAKQSSVQLSTYFVGRMAHYRLRQAISRELGDAFDLGRYNEAVLSQGPVPVKYLPELVRKRLAEPR